jgi:hypothetical protein
MIALFANQAKAIGFKRLPQLPYTKRG